MQFIPDTEEAHAMIAAFESVGVTAFDITFKNLEGAKTGFQSNRSVAEIRRTVRNRLEAAAAAKLNFIIRPRPDAKLIQLDDLDREKAAKAAPHSFLMLDR